MPQTRSPSAAKDKIVAVGLLTQRDIEVLGIGLCRLFPLERDSAFEDLLKELDRLEPTRRR